jgi:lipopolysaccharide/colanic/teichoic acid biosynthesis glycosyltransferase
MKTVKRILDVVLSGVGLVSLSPVLGVIGLLIKIDSPGPMLFRQERVGRNARVFRIYKFRTMYTHPSGISRELTVKGDVRITRVGSFLRKYKMDELPQLVNVLVGDMSLVGPRPEVPRYVQHWDSNSRETILSVRPGITDLASIEFRNENDMLEGSDDPENKYLRDIAPEKNRLAVEYVQNWTLGMDFKILFRTVLAVIR